MTNQPVKLTPGSPLGHLLHGELRGLSRSCSRDIRSHQLYILSSELSLDRFENGVGLGVYDEIHEVLDAAFPQPSGLVLGSQLSVELADVLRVRWLVCKSATYAQAEHLLSDNLDAADLRGWIDLMDNQIRRSLRDSEEYEYGS